MIKSIHQSHLGMFTRCGEQFRRRYIEGQIIPPGVAARRGSAVHRAAEKNHRQKITTEADLPEEELVDVAADEYKRLVTNEGVFLPKETAADKSEQDQLIGEGLDQAVTATRLYRGEVAPSIKPALVEEEFVADLGFPFPLGGKMDCIDTAKNIIDLKVMKAKNQAWADSELQPTFYSVLYKSRFDQWPGAFIYEAIIPNKTMRAETLVTTRGEIHQVVLEHRIAAFMSALERGVFQPADPGHWICSPKWCGYWTSCKFT